jgi:hypothetical protein
MDKILRWMVLNFFFAIALFSLAMLGLFAVVGGNEIVTLATNPEHLTPLENLGVALITIILNCSYAVLLFFITSVWVIGTWCLFNQEIEWMFVKFGILKERGSL